MTETRVLVVDDENTIRNFLVRVLEREGYHVQAARDGREALQFLEATSFDLLLTDIKMDRLDGVELLREARRRYPDLAVILLTGHATVASAITALREGAYNYLLKPVKNEEILAAVAEGLKERALQQQRDELERIAAQMVTVVHAGAARAVPASSSGIVTYAELNLNATTYTATVHDRPLELTPTEFRLLLQLGAAPGVPFDYVNLVRAACGYTCTRQEAQEIIGTHVRNLRQKLAIMPESLLSIESVRGIGYRLISRSSENEH